MSEYGQPAAAEQADSDVISLQSVVDAHLQRLMSCQSAVLTCHAGLLGLDEAETEHYRERIPPLPTFGASPTFLQASMQARQWLAANALRELIVLHSIYFEQMRQFLALARIIAGSGSDQEKRSEARAMVADKPEDLSSMLTRLDASMDGMWPRKQEFRSLETLYAVFTALASGQGESLPAGPLSVELCRPEFRGQPVGGEAPYTLRDVMRTIAKPSEMEPDLALFYEIFFTAFVICKESSEAVSQKYASQTTTSDRDVKT